MKILLTITAILVLCGCTVTIDKDDIKTLNEAIKCVEQGGIFHIRDGIRMNDCTYYYKET